MVPTSCPITGKCAVLESWVRRRAWLTSSTSPKTPPSSTGGRHFARWRLCTTRVSKQYPENCQQLVFAEDESKYGINAYRFNLIDSIFNRTEPAEDDCFRGQPRFPDGISDISKCHFGFPLATSFPHFMYGDEAIHSYVTGMKPNRTKHESYLIVEPVLDRPIQFGAFNDTCFQMTGVPLESNARSQSNLVVRKLTGFNELVTQFSDTIIPMFWLEYVSHVM
jgi:hypothetical protein